MGRPTLPLKRRQRLSYRISATLVACLIAALPSPGSAGELKIEPSVEVRQTFTDNIDLDTDSNKQSAIITEIVPGFSARSTSARTTGALDVFPVLRYESAGDAKGYDLAGGLAGFGTLEAYERVLFFDAQASISQQVLNNRESASTGNEKDVMTVRFSPYLRHRFGGEAEGEARYLFSHIKFRDSGDQLGNVAASDTTTNSVRLSLENPNNSTRLKWSVFGMALEEDRSDDDDVSRRETGAEIEYAFARSISVILGAGYQKFDDGSDSDEVDDPTWLVGVRLTPGPRTDLRATIGERDGGSNFAMDFSYKFSERTKLTANYSKILETSQERLNRTLSDIGVGEESDGLIDQDTDQPFDPNPSPLSISDVTTETETFRLGLNGVRGRSAFSINGSVLRNKSSSLGITNTFIPVSGRFTRRLSPRSSLDLNATYERSDFDDGQLDEEYSASVGFVYRLSESVRAVSTYNFRLQDSNVKSSEYTEHRILFSLRKAF